ncbi:unnamed protein product, partial [Ectocarpus sp. 12 AP-2014]
MQCTNRVLPQPSCAQKMACARRPVTSCYVMQERGADFKKICSDCMPEKLCGGHFPGPQEGPLGSAREGMADVYPALSVIIFVPACRLPLRK